MGLKRWHIYKYKKNEMASKDDCEICCERKIVFECGANTNCDKKVCNKCFWKSPSDEYVEYTKNCMFCFKPDLKRNVRCEMSDKLYNEHFPPDKADKLIKRYGSPLNYQCDDCDI